MKFPTTDREKDRFKSAICTLLRATRVEADAGFNRRTLS